MKKYSVKVNGEFYDVEVNETGFASPSATATPASGFMASGSASTASMYAPAPAISPSTSAGLGYGETTAPAGNLNFAPASYNAPNWSAAGAYNPCASTTSTPWAAPAPSTSGTPSTGMPSTAPPTWTGGNGSASSSYTPASASYTPWDASSAGYNASTATYGQDYAPTANLSNDYASTSNDYSASGFSETAAYTPDTMSSGYTPVYDGTTDDYSDGEWNATPNTISWNNNDLDFSATTSSNDYALGTADTASYSAPEAAATDPMANYSGTMHPVSEFAFDFNPTETSRPDDNFTTTVGNNSVLAPTSGTIDAVYVSVGDAVRAGDVLCMLEVEGIKSNIISPVDATVVGVFATVGCAVDSHDILISLT